MNDYLFLQGGVMMQVKQEELVFEYCAYCGMPLLEVNALYTGELEVFCSETCVGLYHQHEAIPL